MIERLLAGWSVAAVAGAFGVCPATVRKWRNRFAAEGAEGLRDRSSRPLHCPNRLARETTDLALGTAERVRSWDSCFNPGFSYVHGGSVRSSGAARYRQWLTHKLAGWIDQFGTSGCVGCGRCITWCPTGIDLTAEAAAIGMPAEAGHGDA